MPLPMTTMTLLKKQNVRTLALIGCTLTYLFIGAAIFDALESQFELVEAARLLKEETAFRHKYNISNEDFQLITRNVVRSVPHKAGTQWKFAGAVYFSTTVITTIGYGHSTPQTAGGKVFCMLYALVGIPLNLVMFQSIGERLNVLTTFLLERLLRIFRRVGRLHETSKTSQCSTPSRIGTTQLIIVSMNVSTLVVAGGAWAFSKFENWSYLDSVYYCVITLTTVGFGDMVALQQNNVLQRRPDLVAFSVIFILVGLAVVSAAMNLLVLRFLTMNTEDERRDEQLKVLANMKHITDSPSSPSSPPSPSSCCDVPTTQDNVRAMAADASLSPVPIVEVDRLTKSLRVGYQLKRLPWMRSSRYNPDVNDDSDCCRLNWWKRKTQTEGSTNMHVSPALTAAVAVKQQLDHEQLATLPCWRTGHRYKVTRPPSTIEHLLPMATTDNNSESLQCRPTSDAINFPLTLSSSVFHCSGENQRSIPVTYRFYVERDISGGISTHTSVSSLTDRQKRISI